jgi:hypothetical protein
MSVAVPYGFSAKPPGCTSFTGAYWKLVKARNYRARLSLKRFRLKVPPPDAFHTLKYKILTGQDLRAFTK